MSCKAIVASFILLLLTSLLHGEVNQSVVEIHSRAGIGSGVYIGACKILTCSHVFEDRDGEFLGDKVLCQFENNEVLRGTGIQFDKTWDLALIHLEENPGVPPAKLAGGDEVKPGQSIRIGGYPRVGKGTGGQHWIAGEVKAFAPAEGESDADWVLIDEVIQPGTSGGPAMNGRNEVVGVAWGGAVQELTMIKASIFCGKRRTRRFLGGWFRQCQSYQQMYPSGST